MAELNISTLFELIDSDSDIRTKNVNKNNYTVTNAQKPANEIVNDFKYFINKIIDFFQKINVDSYEQTINQVNKCKTNGLILLDLFTHFLEILPIKDYNSTNLHHYETCNFYALKRAIEIYNDILNKISLFDSSFEIQTHLDISKITKNPYNEHSVDNFIEANQRFREITRNNYIIEFNHSNSTILNMLVALKETIKKVDNVQNYNRNN